MKPSLYRSVAFHTTLLAAGLVMAGQGCAAPTDGDGEDLESAVGNSADELQGATCPKKATLADYVICVQTSKTSKETMTVYDRQGAVKLSAEVTTSEIDLDGPASDDDEITCKGGRPLLGYQAETAKHHLKNYFGFGCNGEGIHYYPEVGTQYDSHGCVRVSWDTSEWLRKNVLPAMSHGQVYIFIE